MMEYGVPGYRIIISKNNFVLSSRAMTSRISKRDSQPSASLVKLAWRGSTRGEQSAQLAPSPARPRKLAGCDPTLPFHLFPFPFLSSPSLTLPFPSLSPLPIRSDMSTRKRKQDADEEEDFQELPSDDEEEEEE